MSERKINKIELHRTDSKLLYPPTPRRKFFYQSASTIAGLVLASKILPEQIVNAAPTLKPKSPNEDEQPENTDTFTLPEYTGTANFGGEVYVTFYPTGDFGDIYWKIDHQQMKSISDEIDRMKAPSEKKGKIDSFESTEVKFRVDLALIRIRNELSQLMFRIHTEKYFVYGDTKELTSSDLLKVDNLEASWIRDQKDNFKVSDSNDNDLNFSNEFVITPTKAK